MILENLKVKPISMESGRNIILLNEEDVKDLGAYPGDRIKVTTPKGSLVVIINTARTLVQKG